MPFDAYWSQKAHAIYSGRLLPGKRFLQEQQKSRVAVVGAKGNEEGGCINIDTERQDKVLLGLLKAR